MDKDDKIEAILRFISSFPESTASQTIIRRNIPNNHYYETSQELTVELNQILKKKDKNEIDFYYYLVK